MQERSFKIPIYTGILMIIVAKDLKDVEEKYNLESVDECYGIAFNYNKRGRMCYAMAVEDRAPYSVVAHEALHVVNRIMKQHGIILDVDNDEPQCYLLGWVLDMFEKAFKKAK